MSGTEQAKIDGGRLPEELISIAERIEAQSRMVAPAMPDLAIKLNAETSALRTLAGLLRFLRDREADA